MVFKFCLGRFTGSCLKLKFVPETKQLTATTIISYFDPKGLYPKDNIRKNYIGEICLMVSLTVINFSLHHTHRKSAIFWMANLFILIIVVLLFEKLVLHHKAKCSR